MKSRNIKNLVVVHDLSVSVNWMFQLPSSLNFKPTHAIVRQIIINGDATSNISDAFNIQCNLSDEMYIGSFPGIATGASFPIVMSPQTMFTINKEVFGINNIQFNVVSATGTTAGVLADHQLILSIDLLG